MAFKSLRRESEYDKLLLRFFPFMKVRILIFRSNRSLIFFVRNVNVFRKNGKRWREYEFEGDKM